MVAEEIQTCLKLHKKAPSGSQPTKVERRLFGFPGKYTRRNYQSNDR